MQLKYRLIREDCPIKFFTEVIPVVSQARRQAIDRDKRFSLQSKLGSLVSARHQDDNICNLVQRRARAFKLSAREVDLIGGQAIETANMIVTSPQAWRPASSIQSMMGGLQQHGLAART